MVDKSVCHDLALKHSLAGLLSAPEYRTSTWHQSAVKTLRLKLKDLELKDLGQFFDTPSPGSNYLIKKFPLSASWFSAIGCK